MRRILFASDFTSSDQQAFKLACDFAEAWRAKLYILHVEEGDESGKAETTSLKRRQQLDEFVPDDLAIEYDFVFRRGDPAQIIHETERELEVDLIVLGTHGRKGIDRLFSGSVAETVIRAAHCPVLTSRQSETSTSSMAQDETKILVPIDFSVHGFAALEFASTIAAAKGSAITILHVDDSDTESIAQSLKSEAHRKNDRDKIWKRLLEYKPADPKTEYGHKLLTGLAANQIIEFANDNNYDLVVLGTHGRSGIGRVLIGSVAEQVVRNANCGVITVKPNNKMKPVFVF